MTTNFDDRYRTVTGNELNKVPTFITNLAKMQNKKVIYDTINQKYLIANYND